LPVAWNSTEDKAEPIPSAVPRSTKDRALSPRPFSGLHDRNT